MSFSAEHIASIAKLARIKVEPHQLEALGKELAGIMHWIDQLNKVNVEGVEMYTEMHANEHEIPERDDDVTVHTEVQAIIANAPDCSYNMFAVPKMVE